jgi:hypothetical protein
MKPDCFPIDGSASRRQIAQSEYRYFVRPGERPPVHGRPGPNDGQPWGQPALKSPSERKDLRHGCRSS